jgi:hypothetical protein
MNTKSKTKNPRTIYKGLILDVREDILNAVAFPVFSGSDAGADGPAPTIPEKRVSGFKNPEDAMVEVSWAPDAMACELAFACAFLAFTASRAANPADAAVPITMVGPGMTERIGAAVLANDVIDRPIFFRENPIN